MAVTSIGRTPPNPVSADVTAVSPNLPPAAAKRTFFGHDLFHRQAATDSGGSADLIGKYENWMHSRQGARVTALGTGLASLGFLVKAFQWRSPVLATVSLITGISAFLHGKRSENLPS